MIDLITLLPSGLSAPPDQPDGKVYYLVTAPELHVLPLMSPRAGQARLLLHSEVKVSGHAHEVESVITNGEDEWYQGSYNNKNQFYKARILVPSLAAREFVVLGIERFIALIHG